MAVLTAKRFKPTPLVIHEIAKSAGDLIKRRSNECQIPRGKHVDLRNSHAWKIRLDPVAQNESPRVVIRAIPLTVIRNIVDRMLQDTGIVGESFQMIELEP